MHASRRDGRGEPRILYWFRTPPYVKVGRTALDEEAIRMLEERHPDVPFDWSRILREPPQQISPIESEKRREVREARDARRRKRSRLEEQAIEQRVTGSGHRAGAPPVDQEPSLDDERAVRGEPPDALDAEPSGLVDEDAIDAAAEAPAETGDGTSEPSASHPLIEIVGKEGFMRLRARHASLMARIADVPDDVRREALRMASEPLNPDLWLTPEEARAALETYEAGYEALRTQLGGRRRGRRRGRREKSV